MDIRLDVHIELVDKTVCWWAESPELPGFAASAESLLELRERAHAAIAELAGDDVRIVENLVVGPDMDAEGDLTDVTVDGEPAAPANAGDLFRSVLLQTA